MPKGGNVGSVGSPESMQATGFRPQQVPQMNYGQMNFGMNPQYMPNFMRPMRPQMQFPMSGSMQQNQQMQQQQQPQMGNYGINPFLLMMLNQGMMKPQPIMGNDLPAQGGITGGLYPGGSSGFGYGSWPYNGNTGFNGKMIGQLGSNPFAQQQQDFQPMPINQNIDWATILDPNNPHATYKV